MSVRAYKKNGNKFSRLFNENCCPPSQSVPQTMLGRRNVLVESECCQLYENEVGVPSGNRCSDMTVDYNFSVAVFDVPFPSDGSTNVLNTYNVTVSKDDVVPFAITIHNASANPVDVVPSNSGMVEVVPLTNPISVPAGGNVVLSLALDTSIVGGPFDQDFSLQVVGCGSLSWNFNVTVQL